MGNNQIPAKTDLDDGGGKPRLVVPLPEGDLFILRTDVAMPPASYQKQISFILAIACRSDARKTTSERDVGMESQIIGGP